MAKLPKRPRDTAQLAKYVVEIATGQREKDGPEPENAEHAKRGTARAKALSPRRRKQIAKKGAAARWKKKGQR